MIKLKLLKKMPIRYTTGRFKMNQGYSKNKINQMNIVCIILVLIVMISIIGNK